MERESTEVGRVAADATSFLTRLAVAVNRTIAYPPGHPSLTRVVEALMAALEPLLEERSAIAIGVTRDRLLLDGEETEAGNPLLRGLAEILYRHHVGALRLKRGVAAAELAELLERLAERAGHDAPLGLHGSASGAWSHVEIEPLQAGDLSLGGDESSLRGADLWRRLARTAMAGSGRGGDDGAEEAVVVRTEEIARAIQLSVDDAAYTAAVGEQLARLGEEIARGGAATRHLGVHLAELVERLDPHSLEQLLVAVGDARLQSQFLLNTVDRIPARAILPLLSSAADAKEEDLSHAMLRLLTKLATHADSALVHSAEADETLRATVRTLVEGWTLADPNPSNYRFILSHLARHDAGVQAEQTLEDAAERVLLMGLETGVSSPSVWDALETLLGRGDVVTLVGILDRAAADADVVSECRQRIVTSPHFPEIIADEHLPAEVLARLAEWAGPAGAAEPLLDALERAENAQARRRFLSTLMMLGRSIAPLLLERLEQGPWFVQRNMLVALGAMDPLPAGFSPLTWMDHADARVRREALKLAVRDPSERSGALRKGVRDDSRRVVNATLSAMLGECPPPLVPAVLSIAEDDTHDEATRVLAIRAVSVSGDRRALRWLLAHAMPGRWWWPWRRLARKTPLLLAALSGLRAHWSADAEASRVLSRAERSGDVEIRAAARGEVAA